MILLNTPYKILLWKEQKHYVNIYIFFTFFYSFLWIYNYLNIENIYGTLGLCELLNPFFVLAWQKVVQYAIKAFFHYDKLNNLQIVCLPWGGFFISMVRWMMYVQIFSNLSGSPSLCFSEFHLRISPASFNSIQYRNTIWER